jgi:adenylate cyclase
MRASSQIAIFGWREGMTPEEAKPFIEEALFWARRIDSTMIPLLLAAEGRITVASGGSADIYVARVKEGLTIESRGSSEGRTATLNALLCHAYWLAGLLNEALVANSEALQGVATNAKFDEQLLGLNVEQWAQSLRGRILVRLGRFLEAEECLHRVLVIEESLRDPAVQFIPHQVYVDLAYFRGDAILAQEHAQRIAQIAEKSRSPYVQVYALGCSGMAKYVAMDFAGGARTLTEGVKFAQTAKAALEFEPEMMASLADCHFGLGDFDKAATIAQEAIDVAQRRSARLAECRASIICASALFAKQSKQHAQASVMLDYAEDLVRMSGARVFLDRLSRERARLSTVAYPSAEREG